MGENTDSWHLSKSVPVTLIFALIIQGAAILWAASAAFQNIEDNSRQIVKAETRIEQVEKTVQNQAVMLARIDENLKAIRDLIEQLAEDK
jgi:Tfp pilus assembly protein PilO